jgi:cell cycle sensor histidine kinase DivJ
VRGALTPVEALVGASVVAQFMIAYFLAHTGRYAWAHIVSSAALAALVTALSAATGGLGSPAAPWLMLAPVEAAMSASRRVAVAAFGFAGIGFAVLVGVGSGTGPHASAAVGASLALGIVCATLLARRAAALARAGRVARDQEAERYRLLALNMTDVISTHGPRGLTSFVSTAGETLFGAPASDLLSYGMFDRVHVADRPAYLTALARAAAGEASALEFRIRRTVRGGRPDQGSDFVWVEMRCRAGDPSRVSESSAEAEVVAVLRDISERKAQETVVASARTEAERANAAKSHFLATMSHELRTPLNAVIGFSEMLLHEDSMKIDSARRHEYAQLIHDSGQHLLSVVNLVLDMSKIETGNFAVSAEPFRPAPVIRNCCDLLALKACEGDLEIVVRVPESLPDIIADKRALKQIVLNLLSNAIKFTPQGGTVTVSATAQSNELLLCVADTGVGISADDLPRIGKPFFQAQSSYDRQFEGTGLGLSIVKGLLDLLGGRMQVASRLGAGTQITVHLPLDCAHGNNEQRVVTLASGARRTTEPEVKRRA